MESKDLKYYHIHDFPARCLLDTYFCTDSITGDELLKFPLEKIYQVFEKGHIHGCLLIDMSCGPLIHHLHSPSGYFKEIVLMRATDGCIFELRRWLHDRTGAFCWKHTSSFVAEKQGKGDMCEHNEMQLKNKVRHVIKCDLGKDNITDPVKTPQGDCIITLWLLEAISTNQNDYLRYLRKMLGCLKPGGRLILLGLLNATYYINNGERFHSFTYNKEFVCSALLGEKLVIDECEVFPRKVKSHMCDFDSVIFISAQKKK
ncbi:indolethylamine N-methyltransferase-like [Gastrophryne carolinensis]